MKPERICVRRLKSFEDYSNLAVELCYTVEENENMDDVYLKAVEKAVQYVELYPYSERAKEILEKIEETKKLLEEDMNTLRELRDNLQTELLDVETAIARARQLLEESKRAKTGLSRLTDWLKEKFK